MSTCEIFNCGEEKCVVNNLIIRHRDSPTNYSIVDRLTCLASGVDEENIDEETKDWYSESFINLCYGFDHIANFKTLSKMKEYRNEDISIVLSILVLESD
jgi:hypothetical protein